MRTSNFRPAPKIVFRDEDEEAVYNGYIEEWKKQVDLTPPQYRQLQKAGLFYIVGLRLLQRDLEAGTFTYNLRYSPWMEEARILTALGLDRKDSANKGTIDTSAEEEMRQVLLGLGEKVRRQ